jgi:hypothetical protein
MSGLRLQIIGLDSEHATFQRRLRSYNTLVLKKLVHSRMLMVDVKTLLIDRFR